MISMFSKLLYYNQSDANVPAPIGILTTIYLDREYKDKVTIDVIETYDVGDIVKLIPSKISEANLYIDEDISERKVIAIDPENKYTELVLSSEQNFHFFVKENSKFKFVFTMVNSSAESMALVYKSQIEKTKYDNNYNIDSFISKSKIKEQSDLYKYSKKRNSFDKISLCLYNDELIITMNSTSKEKKLEIASIKDVVQTEEISYPNKEYFTLMLLAKGKKIFTVFKSIDDISDWIIAISNQIFIYKQIATSTELSKSMYETGVAMNKNFIKIASLINSFEGLISFPFTRKILFDLLSENKDINPSDLHLLNSICKYKEKVIDKEMFEAYVTFDEIYRALKEEQKNEFYETIKKEIKDIMLRIQNEKSQSNFLQKKKMNTELSKVLNLSIFNDLYKSLLLSISPYCNELINKGRNSPLYTKVNLLFSSVTSEVDNNSLDEYIDIDNCIKELIIPL